MLPEGGRLATRHTRVRIGWPTHAIYSSRGYTMAYTLCGVAVVGKHLVLETLAQCAAIAVAYRCCRAPRAAHCSGVLSVRRLDVMRGNTAYLFVWWSYRIRKLSIYKRAVLVGFLPRIAASRGAACASWYSCDERCAILGCDLRSNTLRENTSREHPMPMRDRCETPGP